MANQIVRIVNSLENCRMDVGIDTQTDKRTIMDIDKVKDVIYVVMDKLVDIALIGGMVYMASNGVDGWGWLVLVLIIKQ